MLIDVRTHQATYPREIERMIGLFYEDFQLCINEPHAAPADITIYLSVDRKPGTLYGTGKAEWRDSSHQGEMTSGLADSGQVTSTSTEFEWDLVDSADEVAVRKKSKQTVLHVLHELLARMTGMRQPWGILMGVRPLKLVHQWKRQGVSDQDIWAELTNTYLLSENRANLLLEIADVQARVVPDLYDLHRGISIYVGIPFCPTHCAYCTFPAYSMVEKAAYALDFMDAMEQEFQHVGALLREYPVPITSVYVGGGTPTSLRAVEMQRMFDAMVKYLPGAGNWRELTVEAGRPDTITPDRLRVMREYGVGRISVNPQTFKASTLKAIKRGHTPDMVDHRFHYVREAGFENINMDMILGLPGESVEDVRYTMERIERLGPDSVTVHTMSFKRSSDVQQDKESYDIPSRATVHQMRDETVQWIRSQHMHPYYVYRQKDILGNLENIGFAKAGKESIYNVCIMEEAQTIVGIGGGSVTKLIGVDGQHHGRFANPREPRAYVETIQSFIARKDSALRPVLASIAEANKKIILS